MTPLARPLVLTGDPELLDDLLGVAAAVGIAVDVAAEAAVCGSRWAAAPLVLVGADAAATVPAAGLAARPAVLLVGRAGAADLHRTARSAGAEEAIGLPGGEAVLLDRLADLLEPAVRARVVGVVSGRGGAGGSVLAAGVALAAADAGQPAWLLDLDPLGGGADVGMGAELVPGARWSDLGSLTGRLSASVVRRAVPDVHGVAVLAADGHLPTVDSVRAVLDAARRGGGTVVLDLPRHGTAGRAEAVQTTDDLLVVVPAELRGVVATRRLLAELGTGRTAARAVVRLVPDGLPAVEVGRGVQLALAGVIDDEPAIRAALLAGEARDLVRGTALGRLCEALVTGADGIGQAA